MSVREVCTRLKREYWFLYWPLSVLLFFVSVALTLGGVATLDSDLMNELPKKIGYAMTLAKESMPYVMILSGLAMFVMLCLPFRAWVSFIDRVAGIFGPFGEVIHVQGFDPTLMDLQWSISDGVQPDYSADINCAPANTTSSVKIIKKGHYGLDHIFPYPKEDVRSVEFVGRFDAEATLYIRMDMSDGSNISKPMWLCVKRGNSTPRRYTPKEWHIFLEPKHLGGGWVSLLADLGNELPKTFGTEKWRLVGVTGFRLRDSMTIARITVRRQRHRVTSKSSSD